MTPTNNGAKPGRAILTLALGPALYLDLATNLARSFLHWNTSGSISFHIVTDRSVALPADLAGVNLVVVPAGQFGSGFSPKLWLDQLVPAEQNLFIDSDCLCFGPLDSVFDRFAGRPVAVLGEARTEGDFFGDIATVCSRLSLPWVASFVGCLYYLERGATAGAVYAEARRLEGLYDDLGLVRLRGVPNEEPLMGLALASHGLAPVPDDGTIKADAMNYRTVRRLDLLGGDAWVTDPVPGKQVVAEARPVLFHFNAYFTEGRHYRRETSILRLVRLHHWPAVLASLWIRACFDWPAWLGERGKHLFRPIFHRLFGVRAVQSSSPR